MGAIVRAKALRLLSWARHSTLTAALGVTLLLSVDPSHAASSYRPTPGSEILWDRYGVAHVYAKSVGELFYGFGWSQAHSHGDILARLYAQARGRARSLARPRPLAVRVAHRALGEHPRHVQRLPGAERLAVRL